MDKNKEQKNKLSSALNLKKGYYIVSKSVLPKIILDVVKVKKIIQDENISVLQAVKKVGISRTSFYKYCNEVFTINEFNSNYKFYLICKTKNFVGVLSEVTDIISKNNYNILTINQMPPVNDCCNVNISIEMTKASSDIVDLIEQLEKSKNIVSVNLLSMED